MSKKKKQGALASVSAPKPKLIAGLPWNTPLWGYMAKLGFGPEAIEAAQLELEYERRNGYLPRKQLNFEAQPGHYLTEKPDKIVPYNDWVREHGSGTGGKFSVLGGMQVPDKFYGGFTMPEILTHEAQHKAVFRNNPDLITKERTQQQLDTAQRIMDKLQAHLKDRESRGQYSYPDGITGRDKLGELFPELFAHEAYQPAGMSFFQSELGKALNMTPEEKAWYMSRKIPQQVIIEGTKEYTDGIAGSYKNGGLAQMRGA